MHLQFVFVIFSMLFSGQSYTLNKSESRTSSMIRSGTLKARVLDATEHEEYGSVHEVKIDVKMRVVFGGRRSESSEFYIPTSWFTKSFWRELKEVDYKKLPNFKIKYLRSVDGCNEVLIFDIKEVRNFLRNDAEIRSLVCFDIAGIGAKFLDLSGSSNGFDYKAGFDIDKKIAPNLFATYSEVVE